MKKIKITIFVLIISIFASLFNLKIPSEISYANDKTAEVVMELNSNRVLYEKNANEKMYMASTTKILSALVVIESMNLSDIITVSKETVGVEGSSIYLEPGEKLSVLDLLYGLMLRSGNDCAETLALSCSGSIKEFVKLMNSTARKIGANNSNFTNPHGLHNDNHYTTARDLALISCAAMKNDIFRKIVGTKSIDIPFTTRNYNRHLVNKNKMLNDFHGSTGIKTGYTKKAGRCLVSSCNRNGMELICVVLNCQPMFERSKNLLEKCFLEYQNIKLVNSNNIIGFIDSKNKSNIALQIKNDIILPLKRDEIEKITINYEYPQKVNYNIYNEQEIGFVKILYEKDLIFKEKIYTIL